MSFSILTSVFKLKTNNFLFNQINFKFLKAGNNYFLV
jgi:hypothetical protein